MVRLSFFLLPFVSLCSAACQQAEPDTTFLGACEVVDESGASGDVDKLNDPIANLVLSPGAKCPTDFKGVFEKIHANQANCPADYAAATQSSFVSEEAQNARSTIMPDGTAPSYRVVTTRTCQDDKGESNQHTLFASVPASATGSLSPRLEMMGLDEATGIFNYYVATKNGWTFKGNSIDMMNGGECGACHTGGGLVQKEFNVPWVHWENLRVGAGTIPGAANVINGAARFAQTATSILGTHNFATGGQDTEALVLRGNRDWVPKRAAHLVKEGSLQDVLRPLFCTQEINLGSAESPRDFGPSMVRINSRVLVDPFLAGLRTLGKATSTVGNGPNANRLFEFVPALYKKLITDVDQKVPTTGKADNALPFVYPERSVFDHHHVLQLIKDGVVDAEFVQDVLMIDFTRPIFSDARCELLKDVPDVQLSELTNKDIGQAVASALQALPKRSAVQDKLLANLTTPNQALAHTARVSSFLQKCTLRQGQEGFLRDLYGYVSKLRLRAKKKNDLHGFPGHIIEGSAQLPVDSAPQAEGFHLTEDCVASAPFTLPIPFRRFSRSYITS